MTRISQQGIGFPTDGGLATTRRHATAEDSAARNADEADALAYLERTGNADLAVILGLAAPLSKPKPRNETPTARRRPARRCPMCQVEYLPSTARQITCSRACGRKHGRHKPTTGGTR